MVISGMNQYSTSYFSYANISSKQTDDTVNSQDLEGRPKGPGGPPPMNGRGGPKVDTNNDSVWDEEELNALAEALTEARETSFDSEALLSEYDTNGNSVIDQSETNAIREANGFNLSDMQNVMRGNSSRPNMERPQGPPPMGGSENSVEAQSMDTILSSLMDEESDSMVVEESLEAFSALLEKSEEVSFETDDLLEKYDTDGDGQLSMAERAVLIEEEAAALKEEQQEIMETQKMNQAKNAYQRQTDYKNYFAQYNQGSLFLAV